MRRLALICLGLVMGAASAQAENMWLAPWEGDPAYDMYAQTSQMWDFPWLLQTFPPGQDPPPPPPSEPSDVDNPFPGPYGGPFIEWPQGMVEGTDGLGNPKTVEVTTAVQWVTYWPPGSNPSDPGNPCTPTVHIGVIDPATGLEDTSVTVPVKIYIPNSKDDNLYKEIFWQMTSDKSATPQGSTTTEPPGTSSASGHPQTPHNGGDNWYTYSGLNKIIPNPDGETLIFHLVSSTNIEEIVVKTVCAPEPATLGLMTIGGLGVLLARRRR